MKLYILEGCHASGKTTMLSELSNIEVMDENYFDLVRFDIGSSLHQYDWILNWINRVLYYYEQNIDKLICDRGPITSIIYGGEDYVHITNQVFELLRKNNIEIIELYLVSPDTDEHIKRIKNRSGPLMEKELKNLEKTKEKYKRLCQENIKIHNIEELNKLIF
jgi:thymidylate kinase